MFTRHLSTTKYRGGSRKREGEGSMKDENLHKNLKYIYLSKVYVKILLVVMKTNYENSK